MSKPTYHIERKDGDAWFRMLLCESRTFAYCDGYVDALDSLYPSPVYRILRVTKTAVGDKIDVIRTTRGRSKVHTN